MAGLVPISQEADLIKERSKLTKEEWREYTKTVWHIANTTDSEHPAVFPREIPHRLVKLFSFVGETVLDPFAGVGTTALAAVELQRKAICVDQNANYLKVIKTRVSNEFSETNGAVTLLSGDCRKLESIEENSIDLIVTSPPYWNKADYGRSRQNLGKIKGYPKFLGEMKPAFEECLRVLKPGRKCCVVTANVNQYTDHGLLTFPLSSDFCALMRDCGLVMINEIIWSKDGTGGRWGSANNQRPIFGSYPYPPNFLFKNVHEYVLIFAKPPIKRISSKKAIPLAEIMEIGIQSG